MNWRTTAALFVLLLALVIYVVVQQSETGNQNQPSPTPTPPRTTLFRDVAVDDIVRVELQADDSAGKLVWERSGAGEWRQTVPTVGRVVSQTLNTSLGSLLTLTPDAVLSADANPLDAYGLAVPDYTVVVAAQEPERVVLHSLQVGHQTPTGDGYYVRRVGDERVFVLSRTAVDRVIELYSEPPEPAEIEGS